MKILLISVKSQVSRGGIAVWTDHFLAGCEKQNIQCTLVNTEIVGKRAQLGTAKRNFLNEFTRTRRIFRELNRQLRSNAFDVAHLNTSCGTFGLFRDYLVARRIVRKGIPVVTHYHCDIPYWIHNSLSRKFLGKLARLSSQNLVLCENSKQYLQEQFGISAVKVPNFIEDRLIRTTPKEIATTLNHVFFVGRVSVPKGAREMYELAKRFPHITFELAGGIAADVATWEKPDNVQLPGGMPHEMVMQRLDEADVFLFPSHSEGFSVALLESMARGVPALATDVGANADMLTDGCGFVVKKGDVDAMEQALHSLESAEVRQEISHKVVDKVHACYTTEAVMSLIKQQYE